MRMSAQQHTKRDLYYAASSLYRFHEKMLAPHALTSRVAWHLSDKGWSSDFSPLPSAFSPKWTMAFMLRSHNGVYCCGTVGDSHSHSQLSTAKCTLTGGSFENHAAKLV